MEKKQKQGTIMKRISKVIVKSRYIIFVLFIAAAVCSVFTMGKVKVNNDLKTFLPKNTDTRKGIDIMAEEFVAYGSASIMIPDISVEEAVKIAGELGEIPHVYSTTMDDSADHYRDGSALISVSFDGSSNDPEIIKAMEQINEKLDNYEVYVSSSVGQDYNKTLKKEMVGVIAIVVVVIVAVLLFTSRSYFEVVIFFVVFIFAGILNMGTNYWLKEVSSITNSVAIILQLALAIDYSIIFAHRYQDEAEKNENTREALVEALSKAIVEISSSSLTTISGLVALTMMQFRLGYDLGTVLSKGIIFSLLTVFLLMPGLIALFPRVIKKTTHKNLIPDISPWGKVLVKSKVCFVIVFFVILPFAIYFSHKTEYAFADSSVDEIIYSESRAIEHKITDKFDSSTAVAILVPKGSYEQELLLIEKMKQTDGIKSVLGIAGIDIGNGIKLSDKFSVDEVVSFMNVDREQVEQLFKGYRLEHEGLSAAKKDLEGYTVAIVDLFQYLFEKVDQGIVKLDAETTETIMTLHNTLKFATDQLCGKNYDRIVLSSTLPAEGEDSRELVRNIRKEVKEIYGDADTLVVGDITSAWDLSDSYTSDSIKINLLTICFVFCIILCTFKTVVGALVLVFVIQGSIWMNFSFPYLQDFSTSFVTNMIVSAIQMGATIDYAIVLMNRYLILRKNMEKKEAMTKAVADSFATVLTSGSILTITGFMIAYRVSDVYIGHIGLAVGRGALISIILVLTVLPQLIMLFDKAIEKTTLFKRKVETD